MFDVHLHWMTFVPLFLFAAWGWWSAYRYWAAMWSALDQSEAIIGDLRDRSQEVFELREKLGLPLTPLTSQKRKST